MRTLAHSQRVLFTFLLVKQSFISAFGHLYRAVFVFARLASVHLKIEAVLRQRSQLIWTI
jgi:hypothetical protein